MSENRRSSRLHNRQPPPEPSPAVAPPTTKKRQAEALANDETPATKKAKKTGGAKNVTRDATPLKSSRKQSSAKNAREKSVSVEKQPEPEKEEEPIEILPCKLVEGQPLPTISRPQPLDLPDSQYQSIAESAVLIASLKRSREAWLTGNHFQKYFTKIIRKKPKDRTEEDNAAIMREKALLKNMIKLGECTLTIDPHIFDVALWLVREPPPPPAPRQPPQYNHHHNAPAGVAFAPPYNPPPRAPGYHVQHPTPTPTPTHPHSRTTPYTTPRPPPASPYQKYPQSTSTPSPAPARTPAPAQRQTPNNNTSSSSNSSAPDPVIHMLAQRAGADPELKAVMKVVAAGKASAEQLRYFQGHIDELTEILNQRQRAAAPPAQPNTTPRPAQQSSTPTSAQGTRAPMTSQQHQQHPAQRLPNTPTTAQHTPAKPGTTQQSHHSPAQNTPSHQTVQPTQQAQRPLSNPAVQATPQRPNQQPSQQSQPQAKISGTPSVPSTLQHSSQPAQPAQALRPPSSQQPTQTPTPQTPATQPAAHSSATSQTPSKPPTSQAGPQPPVTPQVPVQKPSTTHMDPQKPVTQPNPPQKPPTPQGQQQPILKPPTPQTPNSQHALQKPAGAQGSVQSQPQVPQNIPTNGTSTTHQGAHKPPTPHIPGTALQTPSKPTQSQPLNTANQQHAPPRPHQTPVQQPPSLNRPTSNAAPNQAHHPHQTPSTQSARPAVAGQPHHYNQAPPPARSPYPPPPPQPPKPTFRHVYFEFLEGNGDRMVFPEMSILEYLPGGRQVRFSFLVVKPNPPTEAKPATPAAPASTPSKGKGKTEAAAATATPTPTPAPATPTAQGTPATPTPAAPSSATATTPAPNSEAKSTVAATGPSPSPNPTTTASTPTPKTAAAPTPASKDAKDPKKDPLAPKSPKTIAEEASVGPNGKKGTYQPVTGMMYSENPSILEHLSRAVRPVEEVKKYMEMVFEQFERGETKALALRLPREEMVGVGGGEGANGVVKKEESIAAVGEEGKKRKGS